MQIIDDGIGFDPQAAEAGRHFGLKGMRERAELIHARLEVLSHPGAGTRLHLSWNGEYRHNGGNR
jgi:two-component system sensor histidine kinase DegS